MLGMDAPVSLEKPKERDYVSADSLQPNGESTSQSHDSKLPGEPVDDSNCNAKIATLSPISATPCRENGDSVFLTNSPLSSESPKSPNVDGFNSTESEGGSGSGLGQDTSPRTPQEGVFDPFAPGPEEMLLAPVCRKVVREAQKLVARRLSFDDDDDGDYDYDYDIDEDVGVFLNAKDIDKEVDTLCEKVVMHAVYETLLEAIVLKQNEDFLGQNQCSDLGELVGTPPSPPPSLTGITETCPRAPMKGVATKSRKIDPGLCRKLEF